MAGEKGGEGEVANYGRSGWSENFLWGFSGLIQFEAKTKINKTYAKTTFWRV